MPLHAAAVVSCVTFAAGQVSLNFFNAWALKREQLPGFSYPIFYTMWHMVVSALGALLLMACVARPPTGLPSARQFWEYKHIVVTLALLTTISLGLNNISLTLVSLFINQTIKSCSPLGTAVFSFLIAKQRYSLVIVASVVALCVGAVLANQNQPAAGSTTAGIIMVIISALCASLKPVIQMIVMVDTPTRPKLPPLLLLFYDASISSSMMLVYWLCTYERQGSVDFMRGEYPRGILVASGIVAAGSAMAFVFNISTYFFIRETSALTSSVVSNGLKVLLLLLTALQAQVSSPLSWAGISIVAAALIVYAAASFESAYTRDTSTPEPSTDLEKSAEGSRKGRGETEQPTEATPLTYKWPTAGKPPASKPSGKTSCTTSSTPPPGDPGPHPGPPPKRCLDCSVM